MVEKITELNPLLVANLLVLSNLKNEIDETLGSDNNYLQAKSKAISKCFYMSERTGFKDFFKEVSDCVYKVTY